MKLKDKQLRELAIKLVEKYRLTPVLDTQVLHTTVGDLHRAIRGFMPPTNTYGRERHRRGYNTSQLAPRSGDGNAYPKGFKNEILDCMRRAPATSATDISKRYGVSAKTIYRWRKELKEVSNKGDTT